MTAYLTCGSALQAEANDVLRKKLKAERAVRRASEKWLRAELKSRVRTSQCSQVIASDLACKD